MRKPEKKKKQNIRRTAVLAAALLVLILAAFPMQAFAGPLVIKDSGAEVSGAETDPAAGTEADQEAGADVTSENGGSSSEEAEQTAEYKKYVKYTEVLKYGMVPIMPSEVKDGTYKVEVLSSSPFFKITDATLYVKGDKMTADFVISSLSYASVFQGTIGGAEAADPSEYIEAVEDDGKSIFTIEVEALNKEIDCAAFSKKKSRWYDRKLLFDASSLPADALPYELPDYDLIDKAVRKYTADMKDLEEAMANAPEPEAVDVEYADGEYSIEVGMTGGSGRAAISSPTLMTIRDGKAYATLLWSSPHYDYMILEDHYYLNETTDGGNSTFEVPITAMDEGITVIADTTAMGDPVEIEYVLTFYQESVGRKSDIPQEAAKKVLTVGGAMIILGGILNYFVKKKRNRT